MIVTCFGLRKISITLFIIKINIFLKGYLGKDSYVEENSRMKPQKPRRLGLVSHMILSWIKMTIFLVKRFRI